MRINKELMGQATAGGLIGLFLTWLFFIVPPVLYAVENAAADESALLPSLNLPMVEGIKARILNAGIITARKGFVLVGGSCRKLDIPALFALIHHPRHGYILFDTGHSSRFSTETKDFPESLLRFISAPRITATEDAGQQLARLGIALEQLNYLVISHAHADHIGGLMDFPYAKVMIAKSEWEAANTASARKAFFNGYHRGFYRDLPPERLTLLDFEAQGKPYGIFPLAIDLFNDGSLIGISLPGHTIGSFGLLVNFASRKRLFLIADAAFLKESYRRERLTSWIMRSIYYDSRLTMTNLKLLNRLEADNPELDLVPSHDPEVWEAWQKGEFKDSRFYWPPASPLREDDKPLKED